MKPDLPTPFDARDPLSKFLENARESLLSQRNIHGYWEGELSSSALSTATAVCALEAYATDLQAPERLATIRSYIQRGRDWLIEHQNADGGWGDTIKSHSNISTTLLVWGALNTHDSTLANLHVAQSNAEAWIRQAAGSLEPEPIARAVRVRYGRDQTFSVPILMALASTGRLGRLASQNWRLVPQLPFELAAFPRSWFAAMKLPVVSYALPALIAIGLVRHRKAPTWNPIARFVRDRLAARTLKVLEAIQPRSGGFLEAIPLTSFVAIAMIAAGERHHAVVGKGIDFLLDTFRTDGSWAIDTHLATWVSTLSVNALSHSERLLPILSHSEYSLKKWIIDQQYKQVHPFTNAAPGGWSWTPLSGGVPDADDTPGAMLALRAFYDSASTDDDRSRLTESALAGGLWLVNLQNSDGGIPTFCKGWGTLPFDRSNPDITAHALRAWLAWYDLATTPAQKRMRASIFKAMRFLKQRQRDDGAWVPLWFGNQYVQDEENLTYGTSRVLLAWLAASKTDWLKQKLELDIDRRILLGGDWLIQAQQEDGSWTGGDRNSLQPAYKQAEPMLLGSIEETSLAVESLAELALHLRNCSTGNPEDSGRLDACRQAIERGVAWIAQRTNAGTEFPPSPIGFYFAKLWYYEKHYPICYSVAALERVAKMTRDGR